MKMGRGKLRCDGQIPEGAMWSNERSKDPEIDYILQFSSWTGFSAWLQSIKDRVTREANLRVPEYEKAVQDIDDDEQIVHAKWLLEFLPNVTSDPISFDNNLAGSLIPEDLLKQVEQELLLLLSNDQLMDLDSDEQKSVFSKGSRRSKKVSIGHAIRNSEIPRGKRDSVNENDQENTDKKALGAADKGEKKKKAKGDSKKIKDEPIVEEDTGPRSQMPQLLELFAEFDNIQKEKKDFNQSIQQLVYPENSRLALTPPRILIDGFHQFEKRRARYCFTNTTTGKLLVIFDKIYSPLSFFFKISGPRVLRLAPGGFQYYEIRFCSDASDDVEATVRYLIRDEHQRLTQKILTVTCVSCCIPQPESLQEIELTPEQ